MNGSLVIILSSAIEVLILWWFVTKMKNILKRNLDTIYLNQKIMMANQSFLEGTQEAIKLKMDKTIDERLIELLSLVNKNITSGKIVSDKDLREIAERIEDLRINTKKEEE